MAWWDRLFRRGGGGPTDDAQFRVIGLLVSPDGTRRAEVREFDNGQSYLIESELIDDMTFEERHSGRMVGPFKSPLHAERFIVATPWFNGDDRQ